MWIWRELFILLILFIVHNKKNSINYNNDKFNSTITIKKMTFSDKMIYWTELCTLYMKFSNASSCQVEQKKRKKEKRLHIRNGEKS